MALVVVLLGVFLGAFVSAITLPNIKTRKNKEDQENTQRLIVMYRAVSIIALIAALIVYLAQK